MLHKTTQGMIPLVEEYGDDGINEDIPINTNAKTSTPATCLKGDIGRSINDF